MTTELAAGLAAGAIAALTCVALALVVPRWLSTRGPLPLGGVAVVVASVIVLEGWVAFPVQVAVPIAAIAFICAIPAARLAPPFAALAAVPFGVLLASDVDQLPMWTLLLVASVSSAGAVAAAATDDLWRETAVTPLLLAITAAAIYVAVPDTEEAAALLGAALPLALLGWPIRLVALGRAGAGASIALVAWTAARGGRADPASVVGALASIALLVGLAVGRRLAGPLESWVRCRGVGSSVAIVTALQVLLALLASRVGAAGASTLRAAIVAVFVVFASLAAGATLRPPR